MEVQVTKTLSAAVASDEFLLIKSGLIMFAKIIEVQCTTDIRLRYFCFVFCELCRYIMYVRLAVSDHRGLRLRKVFKSLLARSVHMVEFYLDFS